MSRFDQEPGYCGVWKDCSNITEPVFITRTAMTSDFAALRGSCASLLGPEQPRSALRFVPVPKHLDRCDLTPPFLQGLLPRRRLSRRVVLQVPLLQVVRPVWITAREVPPVPVPQDSWRAHPPFGALYGRRENIPRQNRSAMDSDSSNRDNSGSHQASANVSIENGNGGCW
jgi:hypothetical protein